MKILKVTMTVSFDLPVEKITFEIVNELCRRSHLYWMSHLDDEMAEGTPKLECIDIKPKYPDEDKQEELL